MNIYISRKVIVLFSLTFFLLLSLDAIQAQNVSDDAPSTEEAEAIHAKHHSIDIRIGGGLHTLLNQSGQESFPLAWGGTFNLGYRYFFGKNWGIGTGLGANFYALQSSYDGMTNQAAFDKEMQQSYDFRTYYTGWTETQNLIVVDVPLALAFRGNIGKETAILWNIGVKAQFPLWNRYTVTKGTMETRGYYPSTNIEYADLPQHGFARHEADFSGSNSLRQVVGSVFTDIGFNFKSKSGTSAYLGIYCAYAVTNLVKDNTAPLFGSDQVYAGFLGSNQVKNANLFDAGIKIGIGINR